MQNRQQPLVFGSRRSGSSSRPWALLCVLSLLLAETGHAAKFTAALDRDTVTLGEQVSLSLTFDGAAPDDVPALPAIPNLQINYIGPSSRFSFVNGQTTSSITHNFQVTPRQIGEFVIPSVSAAAGGQRLSTLPLKLKVLKPNAAPPDPNTADPPLAFLKLVLPKKEVFLGEVITAELQFHFRQGVQLAASPQLSGTPAEGLTVGKITGTQQRQVRIGNTVYNVIPASLTLTAIKTGPLTVGPITANVVIHAPSSRRQRDPIFDRLGVDFFGMNDQKQLPVLSEMETIQSLSLPVENVPAQFNGAVGSYMMNASAGPTNVTAGDPITLRVQIIGRGALDALTLPEQAGWNNFKSYPPTSRIETTDPLGLQGSKTFEQIVSPENAGVKEIPPFSFAFFDPEVKQYRTLTQPAVKLVVRPGGANVMPTVAAGKSSSSDLPPPAQDIVHIKPRPGSLGPIALALIHRPWFLAMQSVPLLAWLAAVGWRKRTDALANNPRLRRRRQVAQIIRDGLLELRQHATANESDHFFATLFRLLQEQLGERLDCPASAITEAVIDEKVRPRGVPAEMLNELHELFQAHNLARYAPVQSSRELTAIIPRLENALAKLQEVKL